jgi:DNA adenine methylase
MKYMGSKNRIAKHILPIILENRKPEQWYVEPFVGGANMIDKVPGCRLGADVNHYLISLFVELQKGWLPPKNLTKEEFLHIKSNKSLYSDHLVAYAGFQLSYGAMWFSSYRRDNTGKRNYSIEAYNNTMKQVPGIKDINFLCCNYFDLVIPGDSIIYCDPPYKNTAKYNAVTDFDHDLFWDWCRNKSSLGHTVFVSEYSAPDDFECVWQKEIVSSLSKDTGSKKGVEKLFKPKAAQTR